MKRKWWTSRKRCPLCRRRLRWAEDELCLPCGGMLDMRLLDGMSHAEAYVAIIRYQDRIRKQARRAQKLRRKKAAHL